MIGNLRIISIHIVVWMLYTSMAVIVYGYGNISGYLYETAISYAISATIFYLHACWLLPKYFTRRHAHKYATGIILLFLYNISIRYFFAFSLYPFIFNAESSAVGTPFSRILIVFSWQWLTFILFSLGYWFARRQIEISKLRQTHERLELENAALRAQINPHFLFNTLDSFRTESKPVLPVMSDAIGALCNILRFSFTDPGRDGLILLEQEVKTIDSLIMIYRRRFPYMQLSYKKDICDINDFRIPPHILMTFVENAFKHGDFVDTKEKMCIEVAATASQLSLYTFNKKDYRIEDDNHGIGMKYIIRQLDKNFPASYSLDIEDELDTYAVHLKILKL